MLCKQMSAIFLSLFECHSAPLSQMFAIETANSSIFFKVVPARTGSVIHLRQGESPCLIKAWVDVELEPEGYMFGEKGIDFPMIFCAIFLFRWIFLKTSTQRRVTLAPFLRVSGDPSKASAKAAVDE